MKYFIILFILSFFNVLSAQNIIEAEYFFDVDPGVNNGKKLSFSTQGNEVEQTFENINISSLSPGIHRLVVRVKDQNGLWSLNQAQNLYVNKISVNSEKLISQIAYFIDDNYDNQSVIDVTPANNIEQSIELNVDNLSQGTHFLHARVKSTDGNWSINKVQKFYVFEPEDLSTQIPIKKIEYYFDEDENGFGNATPIQFNIENNVAIAEDSLLIEEINLEQGRHTILARSQDETGRWSLTNYIPFDLCLEEGVVVGEFDISINGREVTVTDNSLYAEEYEWLMGNGARSGLNEFTYVYPSGGDFKVTQTVSNFCDSESFSRDIVIEATKVITILETYIIDEDSEPEIIIEDLYNVFEPFNEGEELDFIIIDDPGSDPLEVSINESNSVIVNPKPDEFGGGFKAIIGAIDANMDTVSIAVPISITAINDTPTIKTPFDDLSVCEDCGPFTIETNLNSRFSDIDKDTLTYSVASENIISEIIGNKKLVITLPQNYNGQNVVTVTASDGELSVSDQFTVTVSQVPDPIIIISPIPDKIIDEDEILNLGSIKDVFYSPDGDDVVYQFFSTNENINLSLNEEFEMIITPDLNYHGEAEITLVATSGSEIAIDRFTLFILSVNDPPSLSDLPDFSFCPSSNNNQFFFSNSVNDPDNSTNEIVFSAKILSNSVEEVALDDLNIVINNDLGTANFTSTIQDSVTYTVEFTATDPSNFSSSDTILVSLSGISFTQDGDLLTATEADSYQWFLNGNLIDGATEQSFLAVRNGQYFVTASLGSCEVTSRIKRVTITSLEENILNRSTKIFPNPTNGEFNVIINNPQIKGDIIINIYNADGKKIKSQNITKKLKIFERAYHLNSFANGLYILEIVTQTAKISKSIIKK